MFNISKNQNILLLIISLISTIALAEVDSQRGCRKKVICADTVKADRICADELIVKTGCCACTTITAKDFMDADGNLSQTFVITEPGKYCLGEDITFAPLDSFTSAIQILSNDVKLDLCGNTLRQVDKSIFDVYGVQIGEGYFYNDPDNVFKNITIANGSIIEFSAIGIFCYNGSFDDPSFEPAVFESLTFTDLNILDCGSSPSFDFGSGINLDSIADFAIPFDGAPVAYSSIIIENCNVNRCLGNGSINVYTGDNVVIRNTNANDLLNTEVAFVTFGYNFTGRNFQMFNCQGNGANEPDPVFKFSQCGGLNIEESINIYVKDCQFNGAFGEASYIVNNNLSVIQNAIFENVQFNNNRGGESAVIVAGVHGSEGVPNLRNTSGLRFINCQFNGTSVSDSNTGTVLSELVGITYIATTNVIFDNCQACDIQTTNPFFFAAGFLMGTEAYGDVPAPILGRARNITFRDCVASDITAGTHTFGIVVPDFNVYFVPTIQGIQTNIVFENCIAERIRSLASDDTVKVAGIAECLILWPLNPIFPTRKPAFFDKLRNLFISECRVSDVRSNIGGTPSQYSAGILAESVENPVIVDNSVSDCDRGILLTGTDVIPSNCFQLAETFTGATTFPPVAIDLTMIPASSPAQFFFNNTQLNSISIAPSASTIHTITDLIYPIQDITALGWQPGDTIFYDCNGGDPISDLVCSTTYYLIVYIPGFSENGVVMNNEVDNCSVSGYQDDRINPDDSTEKLTSSAWVNNFAFNNGTPATRDTNYDIGWAGVAPITAGDLANYPTGAEKAYNVSLIP